MNTTLLQGDCIEVMGLLEDKGIDSVVTSPPYYGLRDYGKEGQIGLEQTPEEYIQKIVEVFQEVRRVLKDEGTVWLNLGDTYVDKELLMIPHRVAIALQEDGWCVRQDIVWAKSNPMPEPAKDRCVRAHEYIFLLSKNKSYYFDHEAIKEPVADATRNNYQSGSRSNGINADRNDNDKGERMKDIVYTTRNKRSVWTTSVKAYSEAHFAVFPIDLIEPCIIASCPLGGIILDPFGGSGTTGIAAIKHGRNATLIELSEKYVEIAEKRIADFKAQQGLDKQHVEWL